MLDAILSCIDLWGLVLGFSPALFLPFFLSPLLRSFSFTTKLALSNFLEGQAVHRFLLCPVCGLDGTTVPTLPGWNDDYPLVTVFESFFRSRLVPSPVGCFSLHREPWSSWPARSSLLLGFLVLLRRVSLFVDILSSVWPGKWHTGTIRFELSKMREVTFDALVQRTLHLSRILRNPVSGSESPGLSSTASAPASSSGASRSARRQLSTPSPSGQGGITGIRVFFISWRLQLLRRLKEGAGVLSTLRYDSPYENVEWATTSLEAVPDHGTVLGCGRSSGRLLCSLHRLSSSPFSHPGGVYSVPGRLSSGSGLAPRGRGEACRRNLGNYPRSGSWLYSRLFLVE